MKCLQCGEVNPDAQKYCGECGARLAPAQGAAGNSETPANYTPPHLATKILQTRSALEGERKLVTVLFCDIADSTPLAERIGPDRMHKVLNRFFELALAEVHRFEGTVNQFLGDGFMALFGAPLAHEDHARRAALAALAIRQSLAAAADLQDADVALRVRIGLNTGAVVVGRIGDNLRMDYTAIGDTTNVAARIQGIATPGTILASVGVVHAARGTVQFQSIGSRALKGKAEPVVLYEVTGGQVGQPVRPDTAPALIGRLAEQKVIETSLDALAAGQGRVLAIVGAAGLGKSRLLEEALSRARARGLRALWGSCPSFGRTLSYWSFREAIRAAFEINESDSENVSWAKLHSGMERLFGADAEEFLPYVGTLLALTLPDVQAQRIRNLDGLSMGHQIFRSALLLFERLAGERPTLVAFEDWHWADASSAELLEHLLPLADRVPLVFAIASRPEEQGAAASLTNALQGDERSVQRAQVLTLAPLDSVHSAELMHGLLGGGELPPEVHAMLLRRSGGNPFYLGELVRTLVASHGIERDDAGAWRVTDRWASVPLPDTIEGVILTRIDRLEDDVKHVLKAAAVVGRTFFYRVLKAVTQAGTALDQDLGKLRHAELIDEKQAMPELEYVFKHPLIQQATYDSLLEDRRRELHLAVGRCIEELFAERLEPFYSMLAYHFAKANAEDKARGYLLKAANHADRLAADEEALELYNAVIADAERSPVRGFSALERAELDLKIGDAHFRAGRLQPARQSLVAALKRLGVRLPRWRWQLAIAVFTGLAPHLVRRGGGRTDFLERPAPSPSDAVCLQCWDRLALIDFFVDPLAYVYDSVHMSRLAWNQPWSSWHILGLSHVGLSLDALCFYKAAGRAHERSQSLAARFGDANAQGMAAYFLSLHCHAVGKWQLAVAQGETAAELLRRAGNLRFWVGAKANTAFFHYCMGTRDWLSSVRALADAAAQTNDKQAHAWSLMALGLAQMHAGEWVVAYATFERAVVFFRTVPDPRILAMALGWQGACLNRLGQVSEAERHCEEALLLIHRHQLTGAWSSPPILSLAEVRLEQFASSGGKPSNSAKRLATNAVKAMLQQGRAVFDTSPVESQRVAGTLAWLCGDEKGARAHWETGLNEAKALGARHAEARIWFERGKRMNNEADLRAAAERFAECGALGELEEVRAISRSVR